MRALIVLAMAGILAIMAGCSHKTDKAAAMASGYPDPESAGGRLFKARCSECHVPPTPSSRTADKWPLIVDRMQHNRIMNNFPPLTDEERREIVAYLRKYSAGGA
ncbi:MAG: hypothetical protein IDH49_00310 [Gammaproteobacteria bacterium]|nr:hypothetical protein [Gammaproteobacteria bacterium]